MCYVSFLNSSMLSYKFLVLVNKLEHKSRHEYEVFKAQSYSSYPPPRYNFLCIFPVLNSIFVIFICLCVCMCTDAVCEGQGTSWVNCWGPGLELRYHSWEQIVLPADLTSPEFLLSFMHLHICKIYFGSIYTKEKCFVSISLTMQASAFTELTFRLRRQSFISSENKCIEIDFHKCRGESKQDAICHNGRKSSLDVT